MVGWATVMPVLPAPTGAATTRATLRCRTVATGGLKLLNYVRALPPLPMDERFGSPDGVPAATPSETLLAALGSCLGAHIHAVAASEGIAVHSLVLDIEADLTAGSMWDPRGLPPRMGGIGVIRVAVHLDADTPREALQALVAHALLRSPVASTLRWPVHLDVDPARLAAAPP